MTKSNRTLFPPAVLVYTLDMNMIFTSNIRMMKNGGLSDFDCDMMVGFSFFLTDFAIQKAAVPRKHCVHDKNE